MLSRVLLYLRTIRRMRPSMIVSRLCGGRRLSEHTFKGGHPVDIPHIAIPELDLASRYLARFDADSLIDGEFLLINERHSIDLDTWREPEASHLWNFNLHYFEWGIALAARWRETASDSYLDCFKGLVSSWIVACPYPLGDAWHPYTISLRLVNWLIAVDLFDGQIERDVKFFDSLRKSIYCQYRHLLANQETHLRANHWWENLKTLAIISAMFRDHDTHAKVMRRLEDQLVEQILPDGVHFERSLMYHKLVLEGMLRVWLASKQLNFELAENFLSKLQLMLDAMASLEHGMGKTPFFNDSADGVAKESDFLIAACKQLLGMEADDSKTIFPNAGYYKLYDGDISAMIDAGEPGPPYMLGHAHCDCLSFELSYRGKPVIVNSGTYAYQNDLRSYFRSTAAHNTCVVGDEEQLEYWGEHRVGRSYRNVEAEEITDKCLKIAMTLPSGRRLLRTFMLLEGSCVYIEDCVEHAKRSGIESFIHVAPQASASVSIERGSLRVFEGVFSPEFGVLKTSRVFSAESTDKISFFLFVGNKEKGAFLES